MGAAITLHLDEEGPEGALGVQWAIDLIGCDARVLDDLDRIASDMIAAAAMAEATVVDSRFHKFAPQGVSGVVIIAESHFAIHTWPERGYASLDVFTCGQGLAKTAEAANWLASRFGASRVESQRRHRGDPRRLEALSRPRRTPLHPALYVYDDAFIREFIHPGLLGPFAELQANGEVRELAEQVHQFQLFTPAWCVKIIEECEHHGGWVPTLEKTENAHAGDGRMNDAYDPDATLSWEAMPALEAVYAQVVNRHVRPIIEALWSTWRLRRWDPPAIRRVEPHVVARAPHHDAASVSMIGYLNSDFEGGGTHFPRWGLTVGDHRTVKVGSMVVSPGGVSHPHLARPVTRGRRYTLANAFY